MKNRNIIVLISLIFIALFLFACGGGGGGEETPTLRVGILSIDDSLPIALAHEEGRYEKAGLDVQVFPFASSSDQSQALEAGELDLVMNDMIVQGLMKKGGTETKILCYAFGATPKEGRFMVLGAPGADLNTPEDLEGAQVTLSTNTMMEYLMDSYAGHFHLDQDAITYVNMPNLILRLETLLEGKEIQGAILPDPLASFAVAQGAKVIIDDTILDQNYSQSVILARQNVIDQEPESLRAFLEVTFGMMEDINAQPLQYRGFALSFAKVPEVLQDAYPMPTYSPGAVPDQDQVQRVMIWLKDKGLTDRVYAYEDMVALDFLHAGS